MVFARKVILNLFGVLILKNVWYAQCFCEKTGKLLKFSEKSVCYVQKLERFEDRIACYKKGEVLVMLEHFLLKAPTKNTFLASYHKFLKFL